MTETTLLYALSTLAQTCAALAAFVGAVGIYKLQSSRDQHTRNEQTLRGLLFPALGTISPLRPAEDVIRIARADVAGPSSILSPADREKLRTSLCEWDAFTSLHRQLTKALFILEGWNLLVIGVSLVGFNYIPLLVSSAWTFWALWAAAVGTVAVTAYSVFAWTRG